MNPNTQRLYQIIIAAMEGRLKSITLTFKPDNYISPRGPIESVQLSYKGVL